MKTLFIKRAVLLAALSGLIAFTAAHVQAANRMTQGQWETTTTSAGKTYTDTSCVTPDMAKLSNADEKTMRALTDKAGAGACVLGTYEESGNKVSYSMKCGKDVTIVSTTYRGDSYESDFTSTKSGMAPTTMHVKAKRVGACK